MKHRRKWLIKVGLVISIIGIIFFNRYSERILIEEINLGSNKYPLIVYKTDVDNYHGFKTFTSKISNKEDKEKILDYITKREVKRIIVFLEPFYNPEFDINRIVPRYDLGGYISDFEIWGNKYVRIRTDNGYIYYKFIDELNIDKLEEMIELKEI